ncbi:MAG: ribonuclease Z [Methanomassiliicoccales archaeon PtaU1.Bin124]|nr:MAG: ribonuclease Z [Methanomassiliicoccales archaeon PtaU1.Bin124]
MTSLTFLGTGGGRFATIYQVRSTGGLYLRDGVNLHIDPGPGALVNMAKLKMDPAKTEAVLISHCHPDHYTDAEVLVEGMTRGGLKKRGWLVGSRSVMEGGDGHGPALSNYHLSLPDKKVMVTPGDEVRIGMMRIGVVKTKHSDPTGVGFIFHTSDGKIGYMSDTELDDDVVKQHEGCRILILALTRPLKARVPNHICTEDAAEIVKRVRPEMALLTHFGAKLIFDGTDKQARYIEENSGVKTVAAEDLMTVTVGKNIRIAKRGQQGTGEILDQDIPQSTLD